MKFNEIFFRIKEIKGLKTDGQVGKILGLRPSALSERKKTGSIPVKEICEWGVKEGHSLDWLLTGETKQDASDEYAHIPLYDVHVSTGHGAFTEYEEKEGELAFKKDWIVRVLGAGYKDLVGLHVSGDSMEPTLHTEDIVIVNRTDLTLSDGIFVLRMNGVLLAKRIQIGPFPQRDGIVIKSDNPSYDSIQVAPQDLPDLVIVGRVVWAGRRF